MIVPHNNIERAIASATGKAFRVETRQPLGGGCINQVYRVEGRGQRYCVKLNGADALGMFEAEAKGLAEIAASQTLRVPEPLCTGQADGSSFLVLEYLDLNRGAANARALGEGLAAMHGRTAQQFGWGSDNYIGASPQINTPCGDWVHFWRERRLGYQLALAADNGFTGALQEKGQLLLEQLPAFFAGHRPEPSLLHGDLWGGNCAAQSDGNPVVYDPAVYYGDRETDLAMTELFGGFGPEFCDAYEHVWPLDSGYATRKTLYNLYHVLNHANLFGGAYVAQAERMIGRLLSEVG